MQLMHDFMEATERTRYILISIIGNQSFCHSDKNNPQLTGETESIFRKYLDND